MTITKVKFANEQGLETGWVYIERPDLTDEEIWKLWQTHLNDDITVFARAILKKASEK